MVVYRISLVGALLKLSYMSDDDIAGQIIILLYKKYLNKYSVCFLVSLGH